MPPAMAPIAKSQMEMPAQDRPKYAPIDALVTHLLVRMPASRRSKEKNNCHRSVPPNRRLYMKSGINAPSRVIAAFSASVMAAKGKFGSGLRIFGHSE